MKKLIEKSFLKDSIQFNGSVIDLKESIRIKKSQKFKLEWLSENEFKILSNISIGTLILDSDSDSDFFDRIKGYGKLSELQNGKTKIDLTTKLRIEIYFTTIIPILIIIANFLMGKEVPLWSLLTLPFISFWFWFIYRLQEKILFRKFKNFILQ